MDHLDPPQTRDQLVLRNRTLPRPIPAAPAAQNFTQEEKITPQIIFPKQRRKTLLRQGMQ
jgi:hypothetical protein